MAEQPGFFDQLVGSSVDEDTVRDEQIATDIRAGGRTAQMAFGLGRQAAGGLGAAGIGIFKGAAAGKAAEDKLTARANGIQVEELKARRRIRKETADITDDGGFPARRKMAEIAARISLEENDPRGLARALSMGKALDVEEKEFDKLSAGARTAEAKAQDAENPVVNAFTADGKPFTGIADIQNGKAGIQTEINGELVFKPFNENFSQVDPDSAKANKGGLKPFEIASQLKKNRGVDSIKRVTNLASTANTALAKTDRVMSTLTDLFNEGGVESVMSTSGGLITGVDNLVKNIQGVITTFAGRGASIDDKPGVNKDGSIRSFAGQKGFGEFAKDAANQFSELISLPEGVERTSAAAQQHRAAVMEMAYMAARLAEPSNRGLSDNDIKNALRRITGDTSSPQVMMRKFLEMQVDAANELDFELRLMHGSLGPSITDDQINTAVVGKGYKEYSDRKEALFTKFGAETQSDGRVLFGEGFSLGADVQPGEGVGVAISEVEVDINSLSDDDAAAALGL